MSVDIRINLIYGVSVESLKTVEDVAPQMDLETGKIVTSREFYRYAGQEFEDIDDLWEWFADVPSSYRVEMVEDSYDNRAYIGILVAEEINPNIGPLEQVLSLSYLESTRREVDFLFGDLDEKPKLRLVLTFT